MDERTTVVIIYELRSKYNSFAFKPWYWY